MMISCFRSSHPQSISLNDHNDADMAYRKSRMSHFAAYFSRHHTLTGRARRYIRTMASALVCTPIC